MQFLAQLGIDQTIVYQIILFLVYYIIFSQFVIKPYFKSFLNREVGTTGSEDQALRLIEQANQLHIEYEKKSKAIQRQMKGIFDESKNEALQEHDEILLEARTEAENYMAKNKEKIVKELNEAKEKMKAEVPEIGTLIVNKLLK